MVRTAADSRADQAAREEAKARTAQLLREIRRIEIQTSRLVNQHLAGSYQSVFKGQGVAFSEVRGYTPGDDVRTIDWNVTARTGEPHVKLFTEERELTVMLLVDMSASLDLGTRDMTSATWSPGWPRPSRSRRSATTTSVGLIGFTDQVEVFVPPRSGRKHVLAVVQQLLTHVPKGRGTRAAAGLEYLARLARGHSVAILISDFVDVLPDEPARADEARAFEHAIKVVRRRHDLIPIRVEDPVELELPALGLVALEDLELLGFGGEQFIDLSPRRAARYRQSVASERARVDQLLRKLSLDGMSIRCGDNWQKPLVHFFARRSRRMRR
jgi:uncharacterized protein (DUF58 family)